MLLLLFNYVNGTNGRKKEQGGYDDTEKTCKIIATTMDNDDDDDDDDDDDGNNGGACRSSNFRDPEVLPILPLLLLVPPLELLAVVPVPLEEDELLEPLEEEAVVEPREPFFCWSVMTMMTTMMPMTTRTVMMMQHCFLRMDFWISIASATSEHTRDGRKGHHTSRFRSSEGYEMVVIADGTGVC